MISITRQLARQLRSVFKHAIGRATRGDTEPLVYFQAGPGGFDIRAAGSEISIEYHEPGQHEPASLAIPFSLLTECEGRGDEPVSLGLRPEGAIQVDWRDKAIPQSRLVTPTKLAPESFPVAPAELTANEPEILAALREAAATADPESSRYALGCIQLKGSAGKIAATDGRQLLVQNGYRFPWTEDLLIPASSVFGCRQLALNEPVSIGRSDKHVSLAVGPWKIHLKFNAEGRFPKIEDCLPAQSTAIGRLILDAGDAQFLSDAVWRLPDSSEANRAVTLDLNGEVIVRATAADQPRPTELVLINSGYSGEPTHVCMDRRFLARAANLGLGELCVFGPEKSILALNAREQMVWMPLAGPPIAAATDSIRIESPAAGADAKSVPLRHRRSDAGRLSTNGNASPEAEPSRGQRRRPSTATTQPTPIEQVVAIKAGLRQTIGDVNELIRNLRRQRRLTKLARSTLASLKELQEVA